MYVYVKWSLDLSAFYDDACFWYRDIVVVVRVNPNMCSTLNRFAPKSKCAVMARGDSYVISVDTLDISGRVT